MPVKVDKDHPQYDYIKAALDREVRRSITKVLSGYRGEYEENGVKLAAPENSQQGSGVIRIPNRGAKRPFDDDSSSTSAATGNGQNNEEFSTIRVEDLEGNHLFTV